MYEIHTVLEAVNKLRFEVRNFTASRDGRTYNWSCLVCGDSTTDTRKARFGVARKGNDWVCHCFNCNYSNNFISYIKHFHPKVYEELAVQKIKLEKNELFNYKDIIKGVDDDVLVHLFFVAKTKDKREWINILKHNKIQFDKSEFKTIYNLHTQYWSNNE